MSIIQSINNLLFERLLPISRSERDAICKMAVYLQLDGFSCKEVESYDQYVESQIKYWPNLYSKEEVEKREGIPYDIFMKKKYAEWCEYNKHWLGFLKNRECASVAPIDFGDFDNCVLLSRLPSMPQADKNEIILSFYNEFSRCRRKIGLHCQIYEIRKMIVPDDFKEMERPGVYLKTNNLSQLLLGKDFLDCKMTRSGMEIDGICFNFLSSLPYGIS